MSQRTITCDGCGKGLIADHEEGQRHPHPFQVSAYAWDRKTSITPTIVVSLCDDCKERFRERFATAIRSIVVNAKEKDPTDG